MPTDVADNLRPTVVQEFRMLTPVQVQKMLGIGKTTLYALIKRRKDPIPSQKIHKSRRFRIDKLMWWIEKQEQFRR